MNLELFNRRFRWVWQITRMSVLILPFFPALGEVGLVVALVSIWRQQYRRILQFPFNCGLLLFGFWLILTSALALHPQEAFLGLPNFLPFIALVTAFSVLIQEISQLRQIAWLLVMPSLAIALLGLGQLFCHWSSPAIIERVLGWRLVTGGEPSGRMSSIFMYANILAAYLVVVFVLALGLWLDLYQRWRRDFKSSQGWRLGFLSLVIIGDGVGLILTNSRNAWGIAFIACLSFVVYMGWRWIVLGVVGAASSILWASWGMSPSRDWLRQIIPAYLWARLSDEMYPNRPVATLRSTQWQFAWEMMIQRPGTGWGLRNFTPLYEAKMGLWLGHPHNLFLMLLGEIGIFGTVLLGALVGWIVFSVSRLITIWSTDCSKKISSDRQSDRLILFTYLVAFSSCILFNIFDVSIFDLRINTIGWILLSTLTGIVSSFSQPKNSYIET